jgi:hypothetical protein
MLWHVALTAPGNGDIVIVPEADSEHCASTQASALFCIPVSMLTVLLTCSLAPVMRLLRKRVLFWRTIVSIRYLKAYPNPNPSA